MSGVVVNVGARVWWGKRTCVIKKWWYLSFYCIKVDTFSKTIHRASDSVIGMRWDASQTNHKTLLVSLNKQLMLSFSGGGSLLYTSYTFYEVRWSTIWDCPPKKNNSICFQLKYLKSTAPMFTCNWQGPLAMWIATLFCQDQREE